MEEFKLEQTSEIPKDLFKDKQFYQVEFFLKNGVKPEAFFKLAKVVAKDSEELFGVYHNLFSFRQEKSFEEIERVKKHYQDLIVSPDIEEWRKPSIETKIEIAQAFLDFITEQGENGWSFASNAKSILEETLK